MSTMPDEKKFIVTTKAEKSVTMTIRINSEINTQLEELSRKSGRSRNELINMALGFAFERLEFVDPSGDYSKIQN